MRLKLVKKKRWRPGLNPTVDLAVFKKDGDSYKVLLVRRSKNSEIAPGKLAFPGGFIDSKQPYDKIFKEDLESSIDAAIRELKEETGVDVSDQKDNIVQVGKYSDGDRTWNDGKSWTQTTAFATVLNGNHEISASSDAEAADWYDLSRATNFDLATYHNKILRDSINKLGIG